MSTDSLKTDILIQTILAVLGVTCFIGGLALNGFFLFFGVIQFFEGLIQLVGNGAHLLSYRGNFSPFKKWRELHFWGGVIFSIAFCNFAGQILSTNNTFIDNCIAIIIFLLIPQLIFHGYYALTIMEWRYVKNINPEREESVADTP